MTAMIRICAAFVSCFWLRSDSTRRDAASGSRARRLASYATLGAAIVCALLVCARAHAQSIIDRDDMDLTVRPGDNFFRYANGGWLDRTEIPADKASYSVKEIMHGKREQAIFGLIEKISRLESVAEGSPEQMIRDLYATGMDFEKIDAEGVEPLAEQFEIIAQIVSTIDLQRVAARLHALGFDPLFRITVRQDLKANDTYKLHLLQGGLGLPGSVYYAHESDRAVAIRAKYVKHVARMLELLGEAPDAAVVQAQAVMEIETRLARHSLSRREKRNVAALHNPMSIADLQALCPAFDWKLYFAAFSDIDFGDVVVDVPAFFEEIGCMLGEVPVADWKPYLRWNLVNEIAQYLSADFAEQDHRFFSEFLSGTTEMVDRHTRVLEVVSAGLGELVGQLYVKEHFSPAAKQKMLELTGNLKKALELRIRNLDWLDESTREAALAKLRAMRIKIGYPDKWKDFSALEIKPDSYGRNLVRLGRFLHQERLARFGKPVDPDEWTLPPQLPNAGYFSQKNEIVFPAGILQPPVFDMRADDAVIYGSIGFGIAHEMIHGFDDQGRKFDRSGKLNNWWTDEETAEFNRRAELLVEQYNGFAPFDDLHVDGKLTLGENIADFGGLTVAYQAYQMSLKGRIPEPIEGFTHDQRFFLAFARFFRGKIRDEALRRKIREDKHPWNEFRVNGAPFNLPEFYQAFDIRPTDRLYRSQEQRPLIW